MNKFSLVNARKILSLSICSVGAILMLTPLAKAQEYSDCYMINGSGEVVDLSSMCNASSQQRSENVNNRTTTNSPNPNRYGIVYPQYIQLPSYVNPGNSYIVSDYSSLGINEGVVLNIDYPYYRYQQTSYYPYYGYHRVYYPRRRYRRVYSRYPRRRYRRVYSRYPRRRYRRVYSRYPRSRTGYSGYFRHGYSRGYYRYRKYH